MAKNKRKAKSRKDAAKASKRKMRFSNYFKKRILEEHNETDKDILEAKMKAFTEEQERSFIQPIPNTDKTTAKIYPPIRKQPSKGSQWIRILQGGATGLKK